MLSEKVKEIFARAKNIALVIRSWILRRWQWARIRPRNAVVTGVCTLVAVILAVLFFIYVLPLLFIVAVLFILFSVENGTLITPKFTLKDDTTAWNVLCFLFSVFSNARDILGEFCSLPNTAQDVYDTQNYREVYNKVPMLKLRLLLRQNATVNLDDCRYIKSAIQGLADARTREIKPNWGPLKIAIVEQAGMYITFGVLLSGGRDNQQAAYKSDNPQLPPPIDDTDDFFERGE